MNFKFGSQIKAVRKAYKLTQEEFAKKAGISLMSLRRYEADERQPTIEVVAQMAAALDMPLGQFLSCDPLSGRSYFWYADLEDKLKQVGCTIGYDEEDAYLWISFPDGTLEVSEADLVELHESTNLYMRFKLEELKNKRSNDFRRKNKGDNHENK